MKMDMSIPYGVRHLLIDSRLHFFVKDLAFPTSDSKRKDNSIIVYMPLLQKCITDFIARSHNQMMNGFDYDLNKIPNFCFEQNDFQLLEELSKLNIIKIDSVSEDDDGMWVCIISIKDIKFLKMIHYWIEDLKHGDIINYGWYSLHTLTGEAYFKDNKITIRTKSGTFALFKEFLSKERNNELTSDEILKIKSLNEYKYTDNFKKSKRDVLEIIKDFRDKFGLKGQFRGLLIPTQKGYKLLPELGEF